MGIFDKLFGRKDKPNPFGIESLHGQAPAKVVGSARVRERTAAGVEAILGLTASQLHDLAGQYTVYTVPKRTGGQRKIAAPSPELKRVQRIVLRRILGRLRVHAAAMAFERGRSIVTHARLHEKKSVVVRIDVKDFFASIPAKRVTEFFRAIGWDKSAAALLTLICTHKGSLPQGAPTSPRLANLLSFQMDARLTGLARKRGAVYSRYADDITYSFEHDDRKSIHDLVGLTGLVLSDCGLEMHMKKKLRIRRRHQRQLVTGLVVNEGVRLPRRTRRWLRAVEHRMAGGGNATLSPAQLAGWKGFRRGIEPKAAQ